MMISYQGKNVVIVGLGSTGLSCIDYFIAAGASLRVMDTRANPPGQARLPANIAAHFGSLNSDWLLSADLIVTSPGIALITPELQKASQAGIEIVGDIELFCREINQRQNSQVIAITGANGKTTVTTLVGEMIKASGASVAVGGNIGQPVLTLLQNDCQYYVLELSSFQLETTSSLHTAAATILNITEDHTDRYPLGIEQYRQAKLRIYQGCDCCVVNADDPLTFPLNSRKRKIVTFAQQQGDYLLQAEQNGYWLCANGEKLIHSAGMQLSGLHNYLNSLAALALVDQIDIDRSASLSVLRSFCGLPHRYQLVYENRGVRWINDSKATNVGSTEAALKSTQHNGVLYLLLGGDGKAADFSPLKAYLHDGKTQVYCFGRDGKLLAQLNPAISTYVETMQQAMQLIARQVKPGDLVLLSPACASLDQFRNYEQRGDEFSRLARELG